MSARPCGFVAIYQIDISAAAAAVFEIRREPISLNASSPSRAHRTWPRPRTACDNLRGDRHGQGLGDTDFGIQQRKS